MLRGLRVKEDITQVELAEKLGISQNMVSDMEAESISLKMAKRIGETFNIPYKVFTCRMVQIVSRYAASWLIWDSFDLTGHFPLQKEENSVLMDFSNSPSTGRDAQESPCAVLTKARSKHKTGLLNLAAELGNISKACKLMGYSRDTFYRYQKAVAEGGVEALMDASRRKTQPEKQG